MSVVQLSSKSLSELQKVLSKAIKDQDKKLATLAQAAIDDLNLRIELWRKSQ